MEKVLVTGANGFLGSNLTRQLFRMGYEVRAMVRPNADLKGILDIPCEIFYGHINKKDDVDKAVNSCAIVIHAAAITSQWGITFEQYENINFTGTKYIVESCKKYNVHKLIYVSTAGVMAPGNKLFPGTELNGFALFNASSAYVTTKYLAQQYILEQVAHAQLPAVIINPTFMIGPNDIKPSSGQLLLYALKKKILFCPPGGKNFVYINDVCQGIINAINRGNIGDCYLIAGHNMSYKEFFKMVNHLEERAKPVIVIPALVLKFIGLLGSVMEKLTKRPGKINFTIASLSCFNSYYSGKKAERELFIKYTSIQDAIGQSITWFRENNYI